MGKMPSWPRRCALLTREGRSTVPQKSPLADIAEFLGLCYHILKKEKMTIFGGGITMTKIVCEECKKAYDYERDDFCPRCGAYNQPRRTSGATVRVDGMNESGHAGSFAHREVHTEKAVRRAVGLDQSGTAKRPSQSPTVNRQQAPAAQSKGQQGKKNNASVLTAVIWIIIILQFLRLFFAF